ncbi:hypothetical protein KUTeg_009271 [Tegillarca granosa]|uniref:Uncharacterized protein n=1 Tax=Tegillarca granosa TaxID=220873 RepID=A0ABQ9F716_TEGGR|nr:hypothetical protein KUTeg_009271 [Tegillarca granosa]
MWVCCFTVSKSVQKARQYNASGKQSEMIYISDSVKRPSPGQVGVILHAPRANTSAMLDVFWGADDDITIHIPNQLRDKIWGHKYVNLALLLKGSAELKDFYTASNLVLNESGCLESRPKVVLPCRTFCRRLINSTSGLSKPFHHIRLSSELKEDLRMWLLWVSNADIQLFTDSSAKFGNGFWAFLMVSGPLGLGPNSDNQSVVIIINWLTSKSTLALAMLHTFVLRCLQLNITFRAQHIRVVTTSNAKVYHVYRWTNFASFLLMRTRNHHLCWTGYGWSSVGAQPDRGSNYVSFKEMFGYWGRLLYIGHAEWQIDSYQDIYVWNI